MYYAEQFMYTRLLNVITVIISALIILSYPVFLILACVFPKAIQCCKKCNLKTLLMSKIKTIDAEVNEEGSRRALLNHESTRLITAPTVDT
jgi:hypothetical protein